jgi:GDP-L-fucose synthase
MEKILVTGADGLIGYSFKQMKDPRLCFAGRKDADLTNLEETRKLFENVKPTKVIHLAAAVGGIGSNSIHSGEYFRNNILINTNVLECARLEKVTKLVSFMSTCVFPDKTTYPLVESNLHQGPPHPSNFGYAYAKRMLEVQSSAYRKEWGCDFIVLIPANAYGPNDNWSLTDGHVIPSLIHKCFLAKKDKTDFPIWGSGSPLREFIYSHDIAKLALWALDNYSDDQPLILSSGIETSIKSVVLKIAELMDFQGNVVFDATKPDGQFRKPSDVSKLKKHLGQYDFASIETGLKSTIHWFLENYPKVRK